MVFQKLGCAECGDFQTEGYNYKWRRHLWLDTHQDVARRRSRVFDEEQKKRCVAVFGLSKVPMKEVLAHFFDLNAVADFVYWEERPDFCIVEFFSRKLRNVVAAVKHMICGLRVLVKLLDEIPDLEWQSICPSTSDTSDSPTTHTATLGIGIGKQIRDKSVVADPIVLDSPDSPSSEDEKRNFTNLSSPTSPSAKNTASATCVTNKTNSDADDVEFVCEQKKNENAPLIEIVEDEEEGVVENKLEFQLDKLVKSQRMSKTETDFRLAAKARLQLHLRLLYCARCRLIIFSCGSSIIKQQKDDVMHLYLDRWGVMDENGGRVLVPQLHNQRICYMDVTDTELSGLMGVISIALKQAPADTSFIVTRVEMGVGGVIDFKFTNDKDSVRCRLHIKNFDQVQSYRLLKLYCQLDDRIEPLLHIILEWTSSRKWCGGAVGLISHDVVIWLTVFFLVYQRFVPSPRLLHENQRHSLEGIDLWYCGKMMSFVDDVKIVKRLMQTGNFHPANFSVNANGNPTARVVLHLAGALFLFYSTFDFSRYSIDIFNGLMIPKMDGCPMSVKFHPFTFKNLANFVFFARVIHFSQNCTQTYKDVTKLLEQDAAESNECASSASVGAPKTGKVNELDLLHILHVDTVAAEWRMDPREFPPNFKRPRYCEY